uniref:Uncharacterized protein n=1 Tax=Anguilla anguilla TaxID=7936 RepID=A0A0E9VIU9_ANGAN
MYNMPKPVLHQCLPVQRRELIRKELQMNLTFAPFFGVVLT